MPDHIPCCLTHLGQQKAPEKRRLYQASDSAGPAKLMSDWDNWMKGSESQVRAGHRVHAAHSLHRSPLTCHSHVDLVHIREAEGRAEGGYELRAGGYGRPPRADGIKSYIGNRCDGCASKRLHVIVVVEAQPPPFIVGPGRKSLPLEHCCLVPRAHSPRAIARCNAPHDEPRPSGRSRRHRRRACTLGKAHRSDVDGDTSKYKGLMGVVEIETESLVLPIGRRSECWDVAGDNAGDNAGLRGGEISRYSPTPRPPHTSKISSRGRRAWLGGRGSGLEVRFIFLD